MIGLVIAMQAPTDAELSTRLAQVSEARLEATVRHLAAYPTRNSLSKEVHEAAAWVANQYRAIPGVEVELMQYTLPQGRRVPEPTPCVQVIATIPGETDNIILLGAHMDSLNLSVEPTEGPAPGANDDASGVSLGLEVCRALASTKPLNTIKFVAFTGEEQGLLGATALATRATEEGWSLQAVLNNDTVGNSKNSAGLSNTEQVRVFSEEGEDHNSRELARVIEWMVRRDVEGFDVKLVLRRDRFGRGGDHTPFVAAGFSGVRFIEVHEEYTQQHTPHDTPEQMDWTYLAQVTRANLASAYHLSRAQTAPERVRIVRDQAHDTTLSWEGDENQTYTVYWRDTGSAEWQGAQDVKGNRATILKINKDDHIFAVGALGGIPLEAQ